MTLNKRWFSNAIVKAGWAPALVFIFYVTAAKLLGLYLIYPNLDIPTHFAGGIAISYFLFQALLDYQDVAGKIRPAIRHLLVFTSVGTIVGLWEFYEFVYDRLFATHTQLGVQDTLSDMLCGMLGSVLFLLSQRLLKK